MIVVMMVPGYQYKYKSGESEKASLMLKLAENLRCSINTKI